ncbi:MAG: UvrB/UvrC motif-containing protein [Halanaerobiaceae bacterium]
MLCQNCGQKEANVHLTRIVNGEKTEIFLCEDCAEKKGQLSFESDPFSFHNLLSGILNADLNTLSKKDTAKCDNCGLSYNQFGETGLFGCSECYDQFADRLDPLVKRIHGSNKHQGKVPRRKGGDLRVKNKIESLREEMEKVIAEENFERAAELRDQIHELEESLGSE